MVTESYALQRVLTVTAAISALLWFSACDRGPTEPTTPAPEITTTSLPAANIGEAYSEGVSAIEGSGEYDWDLISGQLPPGLAWVVGDMSPNEVLITGIPDTEGTFPFRFRVTDGHGRADTARLEILVRPPPGAVSVQTLRLPPTLADWPFNVHLEAAGGDGQNYVWTVVEGSLPEGVELTSGGEFEGTPVAPDTAIFTVEVASGGFTAQRTFTLPVVQERTDRYSITSFPVVDVPLSLQDNLQEAIRRWEAAIVGDLPSGYLPAGDSAFIDANACGGFGDLVNGASLDDVIILVNIDSIDGVGRILGQAGPCVGLRNDSTPFLGILTLDRDDLVGMVNEERITDVIQHEIGHILGFGTLWNYFRLLEGAVDSAGGDPRYTGAAAVAAYRAVVDTATNIPVEGDGDGGTRNSHWDEETFGNELMTGFLGSMDAFLSEMTVASFEDLNYQVDRSAAEATPLLGLWNRSLYDDGYGEPLLHDIAGVEPLDIIWSPGIGYRILPENERIVP